MSDPVQFAESQSLPQTPMEQAAPAPVQAPPAPVTPLQQAAKNLNVTPSSVFGPNVDFAGTEERNWAIHAQTDPTFAANLDDRTRAVQLIHALAPTMDYGTIGANLDQIYGQITGRIPSDKTSLLDGLTSIIDATSKQMDAEQAYRLQQQVQNQQGGFISMPGDVFGGVDYRPEDIRNKPQLAQQLHLDPATVQQKLQEAGIASERAQAFDQNWWFPIVNFVASMGTSGFKMAPEMVEGGAFGPVAGAIAGGDALGQATANTAYKQMRDNGLPHQEADAAANLIQNVVTAVGAVPLGAATSELLKPVVTNASKLAVPSIVKAALPAAIHAAEGAGVGTAVMTGQTAASEIVQAQAESAFNQKLQAQNDQTDRYTAAVLNARTPLENLIASNIAAYNDRSLVQVASPDKIASDILDTATSNALAFGLMGLAGAGIGTAKAMAKVKGWAADGTLQENLKAAGEQRLAEQTIQNAEPQPEAKPAQNAIKDETGKPVTFFHPANAAFPDGNGVRMFTDRAQAEEAAAPNSEAPLDRQTFLNTLRANFVDPEAQNPTVLADAAQAVMQDGRQAAAPFEDALKQYRENNPGVDPNQLLDLAESIHTGEPVSDRNGLVVKYGLQASLPPGGIVEARLNADNVAHVDDENQIRPALDNGAQAVEYDGVYYVRDPQNVQVVAKYDTAAELAAKNPVGETSFHGNEGLSRVLTGSGEEAGRVTTAANEDTVRVSNPKFDERFANQGVEDDLARHVVKNNAGRSIEWGDEPTPEGTAFQDRIRENLPTWDQFGSKVREAEQRAAETGSPADEMRAEYLRQKADRIPGADEGGGALDSDRLRAVLAKGMSPDETEAAMAIIDRMAASAHMTPDEFLGKTLEDVQWEKGIQTPEGETANGAIALGKAGKRLITLAEGKANVSTILHEMAHALRPLLSEEDQRTVLDWTGEKDWTKDAEERFARGFEQYLGEGKATGDAKTDGILAKVAGLFKSVYKALFEDPEFRVNGRPVELSDDVRSVFDRILSGQTEGVLENEKSPGSTQASEQNVVQGGESVKSKLFQTEELEKTQKQNEDDLKAFEDARGSLLAKMSKGKSPVEREMIGKVIDSAIEERRKAVEADRANLDVIKGNPMPSADEVLGRTLQAEVSAGHVIPDGWLDKFASEDWAKQEIDRRALIRDKIDGARDFNSLEDYLDALTKDRVLEGMTDAPDPWDDPEGYDKVADEATKAATLSKDEVDYWTRVYQIAHAKTPEELDRSFAESLTPEKVKGILQDMNQRGYAADKSLPRHVTAQVAKALEGGKLNEDEIGRIVKTMKNDPRLYRRIAQSAADDHAEMESLAVEDRVSNALREADEAVPNIRPIEIPSEADIHTQAAIRLGNKSRAEWQRRALDAEESLKQAKKTQTDLERKLSAVRAQRDVAKAKAREKVAELKDQAGEDLAEVHERAAMDLETALNHTRDEIKTYYANRDAARAMTAQMKKMGQYIAKPVPKTVHVDEAKRIEGLRSLVDPNYHTPGKEANLERRAEWFRQHPEVRMSPRLRREVFAKSLNHWDFESLSNLVQERKALEDIGREKLRVKQEAVKANQQDLIQGVLKGIYHRQTSLEQELSTETDEAKRRQLAEKILQQELERAQKSFMLTEDKVAAMRKKGGWTHVLTISNLADYLDGVAGWKGANHDLLWGKVNDATNRELEMVNLREHAMLRWLKDNPDVKLQELSKRVSIPGFKEPMSLDELADVYIGQKNHFKELALRHGNNLPQSVLDFANKAPELDWVRKVGDHILEEYEQHSGRLFDAMREYQNIEPPHEEAYSPMIREEADTDDFDKQLAWESAMASGVRRAGVERGFTNARVEVPAEYQKRIKLGAMKQWLQQVKRQEKYIAMNPIVRDLNAVYGDSRVKDAILHTAGGGVNDEIRQYIASVAGQGDGSPDRNFERFYRKLTSNANTAYLAYSVSTVLKQISSLPAALPYVDTSRLLASSAKLAAGPKFFKDVDAKSVQMRTRSGPLAFQRIGNWDKNKVAQTLKDVGQAGSLGISLMDKAVAAVVWDAAYHTAQGKGFLDESAVRYADWVVGRTQHSTRVMDVTGINRSRNPLERTFSFLTGPAFKMFNEMTYGLAAHAKQGQFLKAFGTVAGLALSGYMLASIGKGKEPKDAAEAALWSTEGMSSYIPFIGSALAPVVGGFTEVPTSLVGQVVQDIQKTASGIGEETNPAKPASTRKRGESEVVNNGLDLLGLATGLPTTLARRVYQASQTGDGWRLLGLRSSADQPKKKR